MSIKKIAMTGSWNPNIPLFIIPGYFLVLYPIIQFYWRDTRWVTQYAYPCAQALILLIFVRGNRLKELGWSTLHLGQHLLIGGICGSIIIATLPVLDFFTKQFSLMTELPAQETLWQAETIIPLLLLPLLEQSFFSGFIAQSLFKKLNPVVAIYLSALFFILAHFNMSVGTFFQGFIAVGMYYLTGTLYAPIIFQISCRLASVLLAQIYPHLVTLLGFLL